MKAKASEFHPAKNQQSKPALDSNNWANFKQPAPIYTKNDKDKLYSSQYYPHLVENLYFEKGDGEISICEYEQEVIMVTVIDISTLFKEKRGKAFDLIAKLS